MTFAIVCDSMSTSVASDRLGPPLLLHRSYDSVNQSYAKLTSCQCAPIIIPVSDYRARFTYTYIRMRVRVNGRKRGS